MDEYISKAKLIKRAERSWLYFAILGLVREIPAEDVEPAEELALLEAKNEVLGQENDWLKEENKRLHKENFWLTGAGRTSHFPTKEDGGEDVDQQRQAERPDV